MSSIRNLRLTDSCDNFLEEKSFSYMKITRSLILNHFRSCIHHLKLEVCSDKHINHVSLQVRLTAEAGRLLQINDKTINEELLTGGNSSKLGKTR